MWQERTAHCGSSVKDCCTQIRELLHYNGWPIDPEHFKRLAPKSGNYCTTMVGWLNQKTLKDCCTQIRELLHNGWLIDPDSFFHSPTTYIHPFSQVSSLILQFRYIKPGKCSSLSFPFHILWWANAEAETKVTLQWECRQIKGFFIFQAWNTSDNSSACIRLSNLCLPGHSTSFFRNPLQTWSGVWHIYWLAFRPDNMIPFAVDSA